MNKKRNRQTTTTKNTKRQTAFKINRLPKNTNKQHRDLEERNDYNNESELAMIAICDYISSALMLSQTLYPLLPPLIIPLLYCTLTQKIHFLPPSIQKHRIALKIPNFQKAQKFRSTITTQKIRTRNILHQIFAQQKSMRPTN